MRDDDKKGRSGSDPLVLPSSNCTLEFSSLQTRNERERQQTWRDSSGFEDEVLVMRRQDECSSQKAWEYYIYYASHPRFHSFPPSYLGYSELRSTRSDFPSSKTDWLVVMMSLVRDMIKESKSNYSTVYPLTWRSERKQSLLDKKPKFIPTMEWPGFRTRKKRANRNNSEWPQFDSN